MLMMLRNLSIAFIAVTSLILTPPIAIASLIQIHSGGEPLVFDSVTKEYWQANLLRFLDLTYEEQVSKVALDNAHGYALIRTWEIATPEKVQSLCDSRENQSATASLFTPHGPLERRLW